jgi:light-regulated signal transduction histidine kinase (bacteriophytochrome)
MTIERSALQHQIASRMDQALISFPAPSQVDSLAHGELRRCRRNENCFTEMNELIHDLRQPLDVIESLAFYLEITSPDQCVRERLQKIQAMVARANQILQHSVSV